MARWWQVDPAAEKYYSWSGYNYVMDSPVRLVDPDGRASTDLIITSKDGEELFTLDDGKKEVSYMTAQEAYKKGIQWFEETADNYMPLIAIWEGCSSDRLRHFTWDEIAEFAEKDRFLLSYLSGGTGDWKKEGNPGDGYLLVTVDDMPYWADAIGQIPFAVDQFKKALKATGSVDKARAITIKRGKEMGNGSLWNRIPDYSNSYDNAMIERAINWAAKRYRAVRHEAVPIGVFYTLKRTNYSPSNLGLVPH